MDPSDRPVAVVLEEVVGDREAWLPLLLEADESEVIVRAYLDAGELLVITRDGNPVGVVLLIREGDETEIKNLAIFEPERGQGYGSAALHVITDRARASGAARLVVGSADAAPAANRFYERAGFARVGVRVGFFDDYPEPLFEDGVQLHDMVLFGLDLT